MEAQLLSEELSEGLLKQLRAELRLEALWLEQLLARASRRVSSQGSASTLAGESGGGTVPGHLACPEE
eukprot:8228938-Karenia_brevis.AAC.1